MVFKNIAGFLKRNAETIMLVFVLICVLGSTALAKNYDVVYPCENEMICNEAELYDGGVLFAKIELLNKIEPIQEGIRIKDCDLFDCRVKLKITPTENVTINNNKKIEGWFEYNKKLVEFMGVQILLDNEWQELDLQGGDKYDMIAGTSYTFGVDYRKHNVNDSVDLIPVIFGASIDEWAWWIPNYYYRLPVKLSNTGVELADYQVNVTGIDINEAIENGTYMRWTWLNETSGNEQEVEFWRSDGNHSETAWDFSTASGSVWVRTPLIPVGTNSSTLYLYYSDPVSGIGWEDKSNPDDTFYFYDNCSNLDKWDNLSTVRMSISSGRCYANAASYYVRERSSQILYPGIDTVTEWNGTMTATTGAWVFTQSYSSASYGNARLRTSANYSISTVSTGTHTVTGPAADSLMWEVKQVVNSSGIDVWRNGTLETSSNNVSIRCGTPSNSYCYITIQVYAASMLLDNLRQRQYANTEPTVAFGDLEESDILLVEVEPQDLDSTNLLDGDLFTSWDVVSPEDPNTLEFHIDTNATYSSCLIRINGTDNCGVYEAQKDVDGGNVNFTMPWYGIYPGTYNIDEATMRTTEHTVGTLTNYNNMLAVEILNVSNITKYGYLQVMISPTNTYSRGMEVYYCNSSYQFGEVINRTSPATSWTAANCTLFGYIPSNATYNNTYGYASHMFIPFHVNTTTKKIANRTIVTSQSYFIFKPIASEYTGASPWRYYYLNTEVRENATRLTTDGGLSWTSQPIVIDAHLHQFNGTEYTYFWAEGTYNTTAISDWLDPVDLPPTAPIINDSIGVASPITYENYRRAYGSPTGLYWINSTSYSSDEIRYNTRVVYDNRSVWRVEGTGMTGNMDYYYTYPNTTRGYYYYVIEANNTATGKTSLSEVMIYNDVNISAVAGVVGTNCPTYFTPLMNYTFYWERNEFNATVNITNVQIQVPSETGVPYTNEIGMSFTNVNNVLLVCRPKLWNESTQGGNHTEHPYTVNLQTIYGNDLSSIRLESISGLNESSNESERLYVLELANGNYYTFKVTNDYTLPIQGARITLWHWSVPQDKWITTESVVTDVTGHATTFLQSFTPYYLDVSATGYQSINVSFTPGTVTFQTIVLHIGSDDPDANETYPGPGDGGFQQGFEYIWTDTMIKWTPKQTYLNTGVLASWNVTLANKTTLVPANHSPLEYYGMLITFKPKNDTGANATVIYNTTVTNSTYSGYLSYYVNESGTYYQEMWFKREGFIEYRPPGISYYIDKNETGVAYARRTIKDMISPFGFYLFAVICALLAAGYTSRYSLTGAAVMGFFVLAAFTSLWPDAPLYCAGGIANEDVEFCRVHQDLSECNPTGCITALMASVFTVIIMAGVYVIRVL